MGVLRRVRLLTERRFGGLSSFSSGGLRSLLGRAAAQALIEANGWSLDQAITYLRDHPEAVERRF